MSGHSAKLGNTNLGMYFWGKGFKKEKKHEFNFGLELDVQAYFHASCGILANFHLTNFETLLPNFYLFSTPV